jgi:predicted transcriptional regulator
MEMVSDVLETREEMKTTKVSSVMSTWDYYTTRSYHSLFFAAEIMARNNAHRVILTNWRDRPCGIFTQSMLVGEVYNNLNILPNVIKKMPVRNMTKTYWVDTISEDSTAIAAFKRLSNYGRHGMAIVNDEGAVVDELCHKDLKGLSDPESFLNLYKTVKEFKKLVRDKSSKTIAPVATVTPKNTFEDVIRLMDQNPTARVYVVTPKTKRPLYTLTSTDVIKQMFPNATAW